MCPVTAGWYEAPPCQMVFHRGGWVTLPATHGDPVVSICGGQAGHCYAIVQQGDNHSPKSCWHPWRDEYLVRMTEDLKALTQGAQARGWASGFGDIDSIRKQAASLGWTEVSTRRGDAAVSVLRPVDAAAAHPRSLSAAYGLGKQPLHTDGAHLTDPPELVVLISQCPSTTPTQLWRAIGTPRRRTQGVTLTVLRHGMFLVHNRHDSFYAPALFGNQYRFDPGCMTACDARAREVEQYFANQITQAAAYEWQYAGQVLIIDNHRTLHARSAVAEDDLDRKLVRIAFRTKGAQ